jgi:predicted RNase H-like HicB family nuclease
MIVQELPDKLSSRWKDNARLDILEKEVFLLRDRVERLERSQPIEVPVQSFAPDPYEVIKPLHVMVQRVEDDYIASFFDAEIAASGDTPEEAVFNLKDIIMACFESLTKHKETELGPGPRRQLAVLKDFIRRTA